MNLDDFLSRSRKRLAGFLTEFLDAKKSETAGVNAWGRDVTERLGAYTLRGKMIRGALVLLGCRAAGSRITQDAVRAGAAMELIQSALLIHDDIMDNDILRRGEPSFHRRYAALGGRENIAGAEHFGLSMGLCGGDIAIFLAFEALAGMRTADRQTLAAVRLFARELTLVGLGQMQDLYAGATSRKISEKDILDLYLYKTARYSFSLPLAVGCLIGGGSPALRRGLERCGEHLGLIFQLRDDDLGMFGNEQEIGKPVGSDIREGKKTLHRHLLTERAPAGERKKLEKIFGRADASEKDIQVVRDRAERLGVREEVGRRIEALRRKAEAGIHRLPAAERYRTLLHELLAYSITRKK